MPAAELEDMKRKMLRPIPMRGIELKVTVAVMLLLAFGAAWSIALGDWQCFERSGSLVTLVGIGLVWKDLVSLVGRVDRLYQEAIQNLKKQLDAARPRGIVVAAMPDPAKNSAIDELIQMANLNVILRKRIRTLEALVLGIGTLVWGYGAPLGSLVWRLMGS